MSKTHNLKLDYEFCDAVFNGDKTFEIRKNDRGFQKGDFIKFMAFNSAKHENEFHPINDVKFEITYVLNGYGLKDDYVVLAIKKIENK